jgi:foldase protein PrsA
MRISRKLAALAAFFVIAAVIAGCGSSLSSNSVASVAGNQISLQAVNHWMFVAAKDQAAQAAQQGQTEPVIVANDPPQFTSCIKQIRTLIPSLAKTSAATLRKDCKQVFTQYSSEVMAFLIEGYWYQADAYKLGVKYTTAQLNKDFAKAKKAEFPTATDFTNYLKSSGETEQDVLFQIRVNQIFSKLLKHYEKPVTTAAISAYFTAHSSQFGTAETRDIHLVRTKSPADAQAALNALKSGQSWDTVATKYGEGATKKSGGLLSNVTSGTEEAAVNTAIFASPVNKLVGPIKGIFGSYALDVVKITPATHETLAKATKTIKSLLTSQQQQKAETKVTAYSKKHWLSMTTCRTRYSVTDCAGYKAPKTTPAVTTTPTTATTTATSTSTTGTSTTGTSTTGTGTTGTGTATTG